MPCDQVATLGAARARHAQVEGLARSSRFATQRIAVGLPLRLQHQRQAIDNNIQKTAHAQAQHRHQRRIKTT